MYHLSEEETNTTAVIVFRHMKVGDQRLEYESSNTQKLLAGVFVKPLQIFRDIKTINL